MPREVNGMVTLFNTVTGHGTIWSREEVPGGHLLRFNDEDVVTEGMRSGCIVICEVHADAGHVMAHAKNVRVYQEL
jgi:hypothetical protein